MMAGCASTPNIGNSKVAGPVAKVDGKKFLIRDSNGDWTESFLNGVDLGAAKAGYFPGEFGIKKDDYLRWFQEISDMNVQVIRVYVTQMPTFYEALLEFNKKNTAAALSYGRRLCE